MVVGEHNGTGRHNTHTTGNTDTDDGEPPPRAINVAGSKAGSSEEVSCCSKAAVLSGISSLTQAKGKAN